MRLGFLIYLVLSSWCATAQKAKTPLFKNGDKVCFIGNSITNSGEFYNFIYLYYATRYPQEQLQFINCGISGDVAAGVLKRMDKDILIHQPNWTVLMVGMNDVRRNLYTTEASKKTGIENERTKVLNTYRNNTEDIVKILGSKSKVILQKPTIYDQTAVLKAANDFGVNDALGKCADQVQKLSDKYNTKLVDYRTIMNQVNSQLQQDNPAATIIGPDRIHPASPGHLLMAYQFLKSTGSSRYVSKIIIEKNLYQSNERSLNCEINNLKTEPDGISFRCLENSLPFPVRPEAMEALGWIPFTEDLNQQILQVSDVKAGNYDLQIDGRLVASYSSEELEKGINLSLLKATPQYQQALKVMNLCMNLRKHESLLRSLKFVEIGHLEDLKIRTDTAQIKQFLDDRLKKYENSGHYSYYKTQFQKYLLNKPREERTEKQMESIRNEIYQVNKPVPHVFKLVKKS